MDDSVDVGSVDVPSLSCGVRSVIPPALCNKGWIVASPAVIISSIECADSSEPIESRGAESVYNTYRPSQCSDTPRTPLRQLARGQHWLSLSRRDQLKA
jgi:hypothetical protein